MHTYITGSLLLLSGCMACHPSVNNMSAVTTEQAIRNKDSAISAEIMSAPPPSPKIIIYDLDQDHKPDTIRLATTGKNGNFYCADEVTFSLTRGGKKTFSDGCWGQVDSSFQKMNHNAVASAEVFIYKKQKQTWVLIFGERDVSSTEPMAVIRIEDSQPEMILHTEIDFPVAVGDDNARHQVLLIGKGVSEREGGDDSLHTTIFSYDPYYVYNLEEDGKIDSIAMEQYNRTHYVWAGWGPASDARVMVCEDGRRQLIRK
ncbi:hypothetical protein [Chitinophaga sp. RAB17]|uniref:hypothetical protein n=1 Tax=Chitinophaga sp. RAB17 TaxID=3233049 RepID=UPI003F90B195